LIEIATEDTENTERNDAYRLHSAIPESSVAIVLLLLA
jgi:hypothetical protein